MSGGRLHGIIRHLRGALGAPPADGLADADLIGRWVSGRDEGAFELLLWRHAPMVLGVCRRVLRDAHEAEDAAQAAFLALARKAGSIGRRESLAGWLYRVAYRVALQARARATRRPHLDAAALDSAATEPAGELLWRDLRAVLDEEVSRLPARYRVPFVLRYLQGRTNEEVARELGCPLGTAVSRLGRARERLRERLVRRGVTLTAAALAAALTGEAVAASVPGVLVRGMLRAAALAAVGKGLAGAASPEAVALAEGVVKAMLMTKVKTAAVVLLGVALLGGGGGVLTYRTVAAEPGTTQAEPARTAQAAPAGEDKLKTLLAQKEREVRELRERMAVLEEQLKKATLQLEAVRLRQFEEADRAVAEANGRAARDPRSADRAGRAFDPFGDPNVREARAGSADQARDAVELLEAALEAKKAHMKAAALSLEAARAVAAQAGVDAKTRVELANLTGQMEVKAAEVKESEVRLAQAKRRLAKFQAAAEPPQDRHRQEVGQRAADIEKKLDALKKELDGLRKELQQQRPARP